MIAFRHTLSPGSCVFLCIRARLPHLGALSHAFAHATNTIADLEDSMFTLLANVPTGASLRIYSVRTRLRIPSSASCISDGNCPLSRDTGEPVYLRRRLWVRPGIWPVWAIHYRSLPLDGATDVSEPIEREGNERKSNAVNGTHLFSTCM